MIKADLHNHLRTRSKLREGDFNRAIDIAAERLGVGGIFGMVNFSDRRYEKFIALNGYERDYIGENKNAVYVPKKKILVAKGQEIPTKQGHLFVLGLGYDEHLKDRKSLEDTIKEADDMDGIIIADHPFYVEGIGNYLQDCLEKNYELFFGFDAFEVYNGEAAFGLPFGSLNSRANNKAARFYDLIKKEFPNIGALCSSDGHSFYELGRHWTEVYSIDFNDFNTSLRKAVQSANSESISNKNSFIGKVGAMQHIAKLIPYKFAKKLGFHKNFENLSTN